MLRTRSVPVILASLALLAGSTAFAALPQYQAAVSGESSLIGQYKLDGDANDSSAGAHHGTLGGSAGFVTGVGGAGQALTLDGGGFVNVGPVTDFEFQDGTGTIEAWIRPTWAGGCDRVIAASRDNGPVRYSIHVGGDRTYTNSYTGPAWSHAAYPFVVDRWYHLVYVFDSGALRIYVDGNLFNTIYDWQGDHHDLGPDPGQPFLIGASAVTPNCENWVGQLDEVAVYSEALAGAAIKAHYDAFVTPPAGLSLTPVNADFRLPDDPGPKDFTVTLPSPAGAGGAAVTVTFNDSVLVVTDAAATPVPTGGTILIPQGSSSAVLKVRGGAPGFSPLLVTTPGVFEAVSQVSVTRAAITLTPDFKSFVAPGDLGPLDVTIDLDGVTAGAGGIPVTLTYNSAVIGVTTAGGTPIPTGGTVTVSEGTNQVVIKVSGVGPGSTTLDASSTGFATGTGTFGAEFPKSPQLIAYQSAVKSESSLVGYYTFDDDTSAVADQKESGTLYDGTLVGTTSFSPRGEGGRVLHLTGSGHVNFGAIGDFEFADGSGTVEMWVKSSVPPNGYGTNPCFAAVRNGGTRWSMHMNNPRNGWGIWQNSNYDVPAFDMSVDQWYHIAVVFTASDYTIYVNGYLVGRLARTLPGPLGLTFQIGSSNPSGTERWVGDIDEVALYSDSLTSDKIVSHYETMIPQAAPTPVTPTLATYQTAVQATPSLISYYTFEGSTTSVNDVVDGHNGTVLGYADWTTGFAGGQALSSHGTGLVDLGSVDDFKFIDGTGTIEAWFNTGALGAGNRAVLSGRDASPALNRYTMHVSTSANAVGVSTGPFPTGAIPGGLKANTWYHYAAVFDNGTTTLYVNGAPVLDHAAQALGSPDVGHFQLGAGNDAAAFGFLGRIDEVAFYGDALTPEQIAAHFSTMALTLSPKSHDFLLPGDPGPLAVTASLPLGSVAPAGGTPITVTFDAAIISVDAGGGPIASGSQVIVPEGASGITLGVSGIGFGSSSLTVSAPGVMFGDTALFRVLLADQGIIIVDDHFDDNPTLDPALDFSAIGINANGPGAGMDTYVQGKTQRERGTSWEVLNDGGDWSLSQIYSKSEDTFKFMTAQGARLQWVINGARVTADDTTDKAQFPGGQQSDCYHQLGVVSAARPHTGSNELYSNNAGGLYINIFYQANGSPPTDNLFVTGNIRVVNGSHPAGSDLESDAGLETVATFSLPGVAQISPTQPLFVALELDETGWKVGFNLGAGAVFTPMTAGVTVLPGGKIGGGWDANTLNDAVITSEFINGGFAYAQFQNLQAGRGSGSLDRLKVCIGCTLATDCPDPFSDADGDGDTDQLDFATFQTCFSGEGGGTPTGCRCYDRNSDGNIDILDLAPFLNCVSGPSVPANKACDD